MNLDELHGLRVEVVLATGVRLEGEVNKIDNLGWFEVGAWRVRVGEVTAYRITE